MHAGRGRRALTNTDQNSLRIIDHVCKCGKTVWPSSAMQLSVKVALASHAKISEGRKERQL